MKLQLLWVGRGKDKWSEVACRHYVDRLPRHLSFSDTRINPVDFAGDVQDVRRREADRIIKHLKDGDKLIALDERGESVSSEAFAGLILSLIHISEPTRPY